MTFGDSLKSAWNFVTGMGANVALSLDESLVFPGSEVHVRAVVQSTGTEVITRGLMIDLEGTESIDPNAVTALNFSAQPGAPARPFVLPNDAATLRAAFRITDPFRLAPGESRTFTARVRVPANARPTYLGVHVKHTYRVRARLDVTGNDPTSDWRPLRIGARE